MPLFKSLLLSLYYHGTLPWRSVRNAHRAELGQAPVMVLFYHRIADCVPNDWTASNANFARQIRWLKQHFDMVTLGEAQRRIASGDNDRPSISITFDDGYAENCQQALPLLIREGIPCTYFVASSFVKSGKPFPHDGARGKPLRPNTPAEIRQLARSGIEIGAHTRTHADLGQIDDPAQLYEEIVGSKHDLEDLTGKAVRYFAFPYGQHCNLNPLAFQIARDNGFQAVCSAYGGFNFPGEDSFHVQRIHVDDDMVRLKNWVTVDPRKIRATRRYDYEADVCPVVGATP